MVNSCEQRNCQFWNGKICTDEVEYVNKENGGLCCRYHPNAIFQEEDKWQELKEYLEEKIQYYKNKDFHVNSKDDIPARRMKDMEFAKLVAYEEIYNLIKD